MANVDSPWHVSLWGDASEMWRSARARMGEAEAEARKWLSEQAVQAHRSGNELVASISWGPAGSEVRR